MHYDRGGATCAGHTDRSGEIRSVPEMLRQAACDRGTVLRYQSGKCADRRVAVKKIQVSPVPSILNMQTLI